MSGGHWDYSQYKIADDLHHIACDASAKIRWPKLTTVLDALGEALGEIIGDMDYDLSGDSTINDDHEFEMLALQKLTLQKLARACYKKPEEERL